MINVRAGESVSVKKKDCDVYCLLGSCVGVVIISKEMVTVTHGRNGKEVKKQIEEELDKTDEIEKIYLCGGGSPLKALQSIIGTYNVDAAKRALRGYTYKDCSGHSCVIKVIDGITKIRFQKEMN